MCWSWPRVLSFWFAGKLGSANGITAHSVIQKEMVTSNNLSSSAVSGSLLLATISSYYISHLWWWRGWRKPTTPRRAGISIQVLSWTKMLLQVQGSEQGRIQQWQNICYSRPSALPSEAIWVGYTTEHNRHSFLCFCGFTLIESFWKLAINIDSVFFCTGSSDKLFSLPPAFSTSTAHLSNQPIDVSEMEGKSSPITVSPRRPSATLHPSLWHHWQ